MKMATSSPALVGWTVLAAISTATAACDDINAFLNIPNPMTGDMEINLDDVSTIQCEEFSPSENAISLETVVVDGGTLTLKSSSDVRFIDLQFDVKSGATLVFDMPKTYFGPNSPRQGEDVLYDAWNLIEEDATAIFMGEFEAQDLSNVFTTFYVSGGGLLEFQQDALFETGTYVVYENQGTIKFRGNSTFKDYRFTALRNIFSGFMRFSKDVVFDNNGFESNINGGCSLTNTDEAKVSFRGDTIFKNSNCEGAALWVLDGLAKFYGKAYFNDNYRVDTTDTFNIGPDLGGAVVVSGGALTFNGAAQFNNNYAPRLGGGIGIGAGDVTFKGWASFDGNSADTGAAFAIQDGTLTFQQPDKTRFTNGSVFNGDYPIEDSCVIGFVSDEALVTGFPGDDICLSAIF